MHMGVTVSVISGKGGTGKTTLCAGIAACLAAEGKRVLCIDADIGLGGISTSRSAWPSSPLSRSRT